MLSLGPIGFGAPWLLAGLAALPVLWLILRAVPPSPRLVRFPGTALLAGLSDRAALAQRTPWWLLALRCAVAAALIAGLAGPVWRPLAAGGGGPLLIVLDAGWAAAPGWADRTERARAALAGAAGRPAALLIADGRAPGALPFADAAQTLPVLRAAVPAAWESRYPPDPAAALAGAPAAGLETLWLSDGLDHPGRADWLAALGARGPVRVVPPQSPPLSLTLTSAEPPALTLQRLGPAAAPAPVVLAFGPDPQGIPRALARLTPGTGREAGGVASYPVPLDLPPELRNRVTRFAVEGQPSAGATWLADERTRRRKVALVGPGGASEGQALLAPLHYLRQALGPRADLIEGGLGDVMQAAPDVIVLVDTVLPPDEAALRGWVAKGGTLIRFAGPRMAAAPGLPDDPLLPVRLRPGGRDIGGALSWGDPRGLAPFPADGPFAGLTAAPDIAVRGQLMAEPSPELAGRVLATLTDGTPVVTRAAEGQGQVVLIHVTANPEWSDLPLSGLFIDMLTRLVEAARIAAADSPAAAAPADDASFWAAEALIDGFGRPAEGAAALPPVPPARLDQPPGPDLPPGLYRAGERGRAVNAGLPLTPASWPGATVETGPARAGLPLGGWAIAAALIGLALDAVLSGWLMRGRRRPQEARA